MWNSARTAVTAPLMTAVSKPKRKPPSAATVASNSARPVSYSSCVLGSLTAIASSTTQAGAIRHPEGTQTHLPRSGPARLPQSPPQHRAPGARARSALATRLGTGPVVGLSDGLHELVLRHRGAAGDVQLPRNLLQVLLGGSGIDATRGVGLAAPPTGGPVVRGTVGLLGLPVVAHLLVGVLQGRVGHA